MELLEGTVRPYAWGSRTHIAALLGETVPSPHPEAELWLGAHHDAPSRLVERAGGRTLLHALADDPDGTFGAGRAEHWQGRLPFLLKVLAADEPLSLQTHPSAEQAAAGFAREEAAGVAADRARAQLPGPAPEAGDPLRTGGVPRARRVPRRRRHGAPAARPRRRLPRPPHRAARRPARPRRSARAVHHLDHAAPAHRGPAGARAAGRLRAARQDPRVPGRAGRGVRARGPDPARPRGALPRRRRRARRAAAQPRGARRGGVPLPARRLAARLPLGVRHRAHGQLRQRAARGADPQARRRPGTAADPRLPVRPAAGRSARGSRARGRCSPRRASTSGWSASTSVPTTARSTSASTAPASCSWCAATPNCAPRAGAPWRSRRDARCGRPRPTAR